MKITRAAILLLGAFIFHGCSKDSIDPTGPGASDTVVTPPPPKGDTLMARLSKPDAKGTITDPRDGRVYPWVKIGIYQFMAANLAYEPKHGKTYIHTEPGLDSATSLARYGRSYDYEAMIDGTTRNDSAETFARGFQGACPVGWILPTSDDFLSLVSRADRRWPWSNEGYKNTVLDSIFMDWATSEEEGGSNSLGLSLRKTYGTDLVCDSTGSDDPYSSIGPRNCKPVKGWAVIYAGVDTGNGQPILNTDEMGEGVRYGHYNVARYREFVREANPRRNVGFTSTTFRRNFTDFSAVRCIRYVGL